MNKRTIFPAFMLAFLTSHAWPALAAPPGIEEVRALGDINGVALACRQEGILQRIRTDLDATLGTVRDIAYDEAFKTSIEKSFLQHQASKAPCPAPEGLMPGIDALFKKLRAAVGH